jgi:hypothetical protein
MLMLITLKTNHTLLGEAVENGDVIIKKPVQVATQFTKDGPMIGFVPFLEYAKEFETGIRIAQADVLCKTLPVVELENQYNQMFGSGIQIASAIPKFK